MKFNFKNLFPIHHRGSQTISSATRSWRERILEDSYTDWAIILAVSVLVAILLIGYAVRLFVQISSGDITVSPAMTTVDSSNKFNQSVLDDTVNRFAARQTETSMLEQSFTAPSDPSR
ncbi:MAG: hypothetical protein KGJ35_03720 [Patescibacteria group bacterium]|nr:hypothetical protein [Patescibacteria group bacterium]